LKDPSAIRSSISSYGEHESERESAREWEVEREKLSDGGGGRKKKASFIFYANENRFSA
jgi:hypothetical protein